MACKICSAILPLITRGTKMMKLLRVMMMATNMVPIQWGGVRRVRLLTRGGLLCSGASLNCYSNSACSHHSADDDNDNDWWNHWLLVGQKIMATQKLEINCTMCKQLRPTSLQSEWYDPANCWKTSRWCDRTDFWPIASSHHLEYFPRQFGHYCHCCWDLFSLLPRGLIEGRPTEIDRWHRWFK